MPKPTKLHNKGKTSTIQKVCKVNKNESAEEDPEAYLREFQLHLCWCIQQLERSLAEKKGNEKQLQETWKVLTVLKNNNQPMIRKRQLMRTHFGDYRAKMAAEQIKLVKMASKVKICDNTKPKATFFRKSTFLTTGDSPFQFNFNISPEKEDTANKDCAREEETLSECIEKLDVLDKNSTNVNKVNFSKSGSEFKFNFTINNNQ